MPGKSQRPWRKELKKQQRKRRRRKVAEARDLQHAEEEARKLKDPVHQEFLRKQAQIDEDQLREAERRHAKEEKDWIFRDSLLQREFRLKQKQIEAAEAAEAARRKRQEDELIAKLAEEQRRREDRERREAATAAEFEKMMQHMESFLNNTGPAPAELRRLVESHPGQNVCCLYERTSCCRYGTTCAYNHRRPLLSNVIVVRHFFMHPLLEERMHREYEGADGCLELNELDLYEAYNAFFEDVIPELEGFGVIRNVRALRNVLSHMQGNIFIEYFDERAALQAFTKLQGRFYAGKQLNVEFSSITQWESAVCGLVSKRKCIRGNKCNYLHLLTNPDNKYNTPLVMTKKNPVTTTTIMTPTLSWNIVTSDDVQEKSRNWRWSESPEVEVLTTRNFEKESYEKSNQQELSSGSNRTKSKDKREIANCSTKSQRHRSKRDEHEKSISATKSKEPSKLEYKESNNSYRSSNRRKDVERSHKRSSRKEIQRAKR